MSHSDFSRNALDAIVDIASYIDNTFFELLPAGVPMRRPAQILAHMGQIQNGLQYDISAQVLGDTGAALMETALFIKEVEEAHGHPIVIARLRVITELIRLMFANAQAMWPMELKGYVAERGGLRKK